MIKFLFFAQLAELAGCDRLQLEFLAGKSARAYQAKLAQLLPTKAIELIKDDAIMLSINQTFAAWDDELFDGDEVGLLPPFSGG